jgi:hypothetical protein
LTIVWGLFMTTGAGSDTPGNKEMRSHLSSATDQRAWRYFSQRFLERSGSEVAVFQPSVEGRSATHSRLIHKKEHEILRYWRCLYVC